MESRFGHPSFFVFAKIKMSEKLIPSKCCKKEVVAKTNKKYCENCSKYTNKLISKIQMRSIDKCRKCKLKMEAKYNYIGRIREVMKNNDKNNIG